MYSKGAAAPFAGSTAAPTTRARDDEEVKVVGLRRRIAENMQEAKRRIPHFMYADEIDVTALEALRQITRGVFPAQLGRSGLAMALTSLLALSSSSGRLVVADGHHHEVVVTVGL